MRLLKPCFQIPHEQWEWALVVRHWALGSAHQSPLPPSCLLPIVYCPIIDNQSLITNHQ